VDVLVDVVRHVVVDDVRHAGDAEAPGGHGRPTRMGLSPLRKSKSASTRSLWSLSPWMLVVGRLSLDR